MVLPTSRSLALKIIIDANQAKFSLFQEGPNVMALSALEERVQHIEGRNINPNIQR